MTSAFTTAELEAIQTLIKNYRPLYTFEAVKKWGNPYHCPLCIVAERSTEESTSRCKDCVYTKLANEGVIKLLPIKNDLPCYTIDDAPPIPRGSAALACEHDDVEVERYLERLRQAQARADWLEKIILPEVEARAYSPARIGDVFISAAETRFMLIQCASTKVQLVALNGIDKGNRWNDPVEVQDVHAITSEELDKICRALTLKKEKEE